LAAEDIASDLPVGSEAKPDFPGMELGPTYFSARTGGALASGGWRPFDLACVSAWHSAGLLRHEAGIRTAPN
jgi:hypothetical protein